ncbi:MAG TPA: protein kinase [Gemmataceae bacterium]|jgi:serine/threonine-protein kinase|nr:protein kinase [Gemmataceae bacterium]
MTRDDDRLADLLERWENAAAAGSHPTPEDFCRDTPEDLPAFRLLLRQLGQIGLMTGAHRDDATPAAGFHANRYFAEEFHAAGGLGVVFRARDEELNRTVALKCMKTAAPADSPAGRRFLLEAEVTSRLEHPGIAPVHGRGKTNDGRPFYAMRFVDGETLQAAACRLHASTGEGTTELRRLLRAFVGVCQTVAYAHSKGIIHRDLKPSNVMVGPFGEVLVMDWGLASELRNAECGVRNEDPPTEAFTDTDAPPSEMTVTGRAKGSPAFMSPEQARGDWARVGPTSDVYSLGSTLYFLLTGKVPYDGGTDMDIVAQVRAGRFPAARSVNAKVPAPLDAICQKAMAFSPSERYESARSLADDVERWLADEPVLAWPEPLSVRARRWVKRHRTLVTSTTAVMFVALILLAVTGYRLDRKNGELSAANERETGLRLAAEQQKQLADERFALALDSTTHLVTDVQTKLIQSPATRAVRESILKDAIARLSKLVISAGESREADRIAIQACLKLGDLYRDVELDVTRAVVEYQRALGRARTLHEKHPADPGVTLDVIEVLQRLGAAEGQLGRYSTTVEDYAEAARLIDAVGPSADRARARNLYQQGRLALEVGNAPGAVVLFEELKAYWEKQDDADAVFALAEVLLALGEVAERGNRPSDALAHFTAALAKWSYLEARRPTDVTIQRKLALAHYGLAQANMQFGRRDVAGTHYQSFFNRAKALADQDSENGEVMFELAMAHSGLALDAALRFNVAGAEEHFTQSVEIVDKLALNDTHNMNAWRARSVGMSKLGQVARARQHYPEAAIRFGNAIAIARETVRQSPDRTLARADLAEWLKDRGQLFLRYLPDKAPGLADLKESQAEWENLVRVDSTNRAWQAQLLETTRLIANWERTGLKKLDIADATLASGIAAAKKIAAADLDHSSIRRQLGLLQIEQASLLLERSKSEDAAAAVESAIKALAGRDDSVACELLERNHAFLADLYRKKDRAKSAEQTRLAAAAARSGLKLDPDRPEFRQALQLHLGWLGDQRIADDPAAALALFEEALVHAPRLPPDLAETSAMRTRLGAFEAKTGDCCQMLDKPKDALDHYTKALAHHAKVIEGEPTQPTARAVLAYDQRRVAELKLTLLDFPGAVAEYEKAKSVLDQMKKDKIPLGFLGQQSERLIADNLPFVRLLPAGIETLDATLKQPPAVRLDALTTRVSWLMTKDRLAEAAATAEAMAKEKGDTALARAAVEFARLAARPNGEAYATRAIECLQQSRAAGTLNAPDDIAWLKWEPLFAPFRDRPAFQELVKEAGGAK